MANHTPRRIISRFRARLTAVTDDTGEASGDFALVAGLLSMVLIPAAAVVALSTRGDLDRLFSILG
jgi:hypothetical protein